MKTGLLFLIIAMLVSSRIQCQTLYVPAGTAGISSSVTNASVGIGTSSPRAFFDVYNSSPYTLKSVLARLSEGDNIGEGTFLGVRSYNSQPASGEPCCNIKSFAIEHKFYDFINSSIIFYRGGGMTGGFMTFSTDNNFERMRIATNGNVGIGTTNPGNYKLNVWGNIRAHEIVINTTGADFVFEPTYKLRTLPELETFIKEHKHLPEIAPAKEMQENGVSAGEMQAKLLQKVEELTLYVIEQEKKMQTMQNEINRLKQTKN